MRKAIFLGIMIYFLQGYNAMDLILKLSYEVSVVKLVFILYSLATLDIGAKDITGNALASTKS